MLNRDFERAAQGLKPLKREHLACASCGCNWFEKVEAVKVDLNQMNNLGQSPAIHGGPFHLLRCLRCEDLSEPPMTATQMSPLRTEYDQLLDQVVDGKGDTREQRNVSGPADRNEGDNSGDAGDVAE